MTKFDRLEQLRTEAAVILNMPIDAATVALLAALNLQHESLMEEMVAGRHVDSGDLLAVTEAITKLVPAPEPLTVNLKISQRLHGVCRYCGAINELDEPLPPPELANPPSPSPANGGGSSAKAAAAPVPPPVPAPVAPTQTAPPGA